MFGESKGFSLVEVLIAVAIVALSLGVILRSSSYQILTISRSLDRYQSLLYASRVLESQLAQEKSQTSVEDEVAGFAYALESSVVTADPRIEQVQVQVTRGPQIRATLSAYRLRIRGDL